MDSLPETFPRQRAAVPRFTEIPTGIEQVRRNLLRGVASTDILRAAGACRREARRIRWQITTGMHAPEWVPAMEAKVVSLALMEQALASLGGAFREMERREVVCQARQEAEALPAPFVSIGEAVERVVAAAGEGGLPE
ncbi:hypothetical protein [Roseomonas xinghualingensis]|uniref:hypothetical protein n=1 Tax=Roseomonas xinghualingensis TaxID=2986475 RepID=UPI0021F1FF0C|nr:hypothetical protein [Roseomonas sp. SXEYE001]MCV4209350.1 hypothetical protein [Roseomonas sp. SXEYE001]